MPGSGVEGACDRSDCMAVGYDIENPTDLAISSSYGGETTTGRYSVKNLEVHPQHSQS